MIHNYMYTSIPISLMVMETTPSWSAPVESKEDIVLKIFNTLTKHKDKFIPVQNGGKSIRWYSCGPTVYDAAHMGHARNYVTTDIIRRILQNYFGYNIQFIMNITDIDDKIIVRARHKHLLSIQKTKWSELQSHPETIYKELSQFWNSWILNVVPISIRSSIASILENKSDDIQYIKSILDIVNSHSSQEDPKWAMNRKILINSGTFLLNHESITSIDHVMDLFSDIVAPQLDTIHGSELSDPAIFRDLSAYWEDEFFQDMDRLGVLRPTVLTRVSEYVPEIIDCIQQIINNGYGYEKNGSIYFDTLAFQKTHTYAKLCPSAVNNTKLLEEGEGSLTLTTAHEKKSIADFALWKSSKPGEPAWSSPWGKGRPGWHIECSAMAGSVAPGVLDIHSGGIDLAFPHHDNELAQSEAQYDCNQWVNYFLHMGHLHIDGQKMSKSLKNFITIQEALEKYSSRQMRLLFLMHDWNATLDYKDTSMKEVISFEKSLINFFDELNALILENKRFLQDSKGVHYHHDSERLLSTQLVKSQQEIHIALCDSFDTPSAMKFLQELVGNTRQYIQNTKNRPLSALLLQDIGSFVTRLLEIFGIIQTQPIIGFEKVSLVNQDDSFMRAIQLASSIRDYLRGISKEHIQKEKIKNTYDMSEDMEHLGLRESGEKLWSQILRYCDDLREKEFLDMGILLEDRDEMGTALVKKIDKEYLQKMRLDQVKREEEREKRQKVTELQAKKQQEKQLKAMIHPSELFKQGDYSKFDEKGIPTHDSSGMELSKNLRKKLLKEYELQTKLYESNLI